MKLKYTLFITILYLASGGIFFYIDGDSGFSLLKMLLHGLLFFLILRLSKLSNTEFWTIVLTLNGLSIISAILFLKSVPFYLPIFIIMIVGNQIGGALVALASIFAFNHTRLVNIGGNKQSLIVAGVFLVIAVSLFQYISNSNKLKDEAILKNNFAYRVSKAVIDGRITKDSDLSAVAQQLSRGIYRIQDGNITHGYGGAVNVGVENDNIFIRYEQVPMGKPCKFMYFYQSINHVGFRSTRLEGVPLATAEGNETTASEILCFQNAESVTLKFVGNLSDILHRKKWIEQGYQYSENAVLDR